MFHAKASRERERERRCRSIELVIKDPGRCSRGLKGCFFRTENSLLSNGAPIQDHLNCPKGPCNMLQHATHVEREEMRGGTDREPIKARSGKAFCCRLSRDPSFARGNIMTIRYGTAI